MSLLQSEEHREKEALALAWVIVFTKHDFDGINSEQLDAAVNAGCVPALMKMSASQSDLAVIRGSRELCKKGGVWVHEGKRGTLTINLDRDGEVRLKWLSDSGVSSYTKVRDLTMASLQQIALAHIASQSLAGMRQLLSTVATREAAAAILAEGLRSPDTTAEQLEAAAEVGCVSVLATLAASESSAAIRRQKADGRRRQDYYL